MKNATRSLPILALSLALPACGMSEADHEAALAAAVDSTRRVTIREVQQSLAASVAEAERLSRAADRVLSPLPVMTEGEEAALRRFLNASHVARARQLGVRIADEDTRDSLLAEGALVELSDSTEYWIVRPGTAPAHVVPHVPELLTELGRRFHERLAEIGLPPYRMEVTSADRTTRDQARLRGVNANAAAGASSHEFGTTLDLSYAAFAPPASRPPEAFSGLPDELVPHMETLVDLSFESVSGRKSRELGNIFSEVLIDAQAEGLVLVIYERQQTVYHLTVGRALVDE